MNGASTGTLIPRRPLLWLTAAFLCLVPTFLGNIVSWAPLVFLCSLLAKFWMDKTNRRLRSLPLKIVLTVAAIGAVFASYGMPPGVEFGVTLLVVLASLKILESHTSRDFHSLIMVGWILCLCAFLLSQNFDVALCIFAAFLLLVAALVQFHRRSSPGGPVWPPFLTTLKLFAQALPLVGLLFLFFPRGGGAMQLRFLGTPSNSIGFSGQLSPGSVASIASSDDLAFRAEFPDGNMPARQDLYWRGAVLYQGDALDWEAGPGLGRARAPQRRIGARIVRQNITMEPNPGRWLFALDRPLNAPPGATLAPGGYLQSVHPISAIRRYEVRSAADAGEESLHPRERTVSLQPPSHVSPALRELVQRWTADGANARAVVTAAMQFFRTQGFVYSLSPGQYIGADALDELLFRRKSGFCEHYAAAFATLMRIANVPSRVVVGYLGGQFNQYGNYLLVRQSDAHAWCEVWLPESGWTRVDPTSVIAPERLNLGSLRDMQTTSVQTQANSGQSPASRSLPAGGVLSEMRLAWDSVTFAWDSRVLSFDLDGQRDFLTNWGLDAIPDMSLLFWIAGAIALLLGAYAALILLRSRAQADAVKQLYEVFCRKAGRLGAQRSATEGPEDFASRASAILPQHAAGMQRIASSYIALRYSANPSVSALRSFAAEVRKFSGASRDRQPFE